MDALHFAGARFHQKIGNPRGHRGVGTLGRPAHFGCDLADMIQGDGIFAHEQQALALLNAEQAYNQAVITLIQAQTNRYADTATLFQALGGGWWNRADLTKK